MSVFPNFICRFNAIPIKPSANYFSDIKTVTVKFIWRGIKPKIAKRTLKEKNKVAELTLPDVKTYHKAAIVNTIWYS